MAENSILNLMISHHVLLEVLFTLFREEAKEKSEKAEVTLSELVWEAKKHFFAEENAIFDFVKMENFGALETINHLKDEHITMLLNLKSFSDDFSEITASQIENFHNLLDDHRKVEEKELYPKLDKELRAEQKRQIIDRINEIPIHK